ncbi:hypothetical protein PG993_004537 [Apiospora rasikravindrae]|uniref:Uncharacterized protein n=1 Tax=Apiospora rasikravindrae TaxID=990691 RepID=A0ABR1TD45_9PEZI
MTPPINPFDALHLPPQEVPASVVAIRTCAWLAVQYIQLHQGDGETRLPYSVAEVWEAQDLLLDDDGNVDNDKWHRALEQFSAFGRVLAGFRTPAYYWALSWDPSDGIVKDEPVILVLMPTFPFRRIIVNDELTSWYPIVNQDLFNLVSLRIKVRNESHPENQPAMLPPPPPGPVDNAMVANPIPGGDPSGPAAQPRPQPASSMEPGSSFDRPIDLSDDDEEPEAAPPLFASRSQDQPAIPAAALAPVNPVAPAAPGPAPGGAPAPLRRSARIAAMTRAAAFGGRASGS